MGITAIPADSPRVLQQSEAPMPTQLPSKLGHKLDSGE